MVFCRSHPCLFIRPSFQTGNRTRDAYWALVESYRTEGGPRQRVVAWLGKLDEAGRLGVQPAAAGNSASSATQRTLLDEAEAEPRWIEVNAAAVRVENCRPWGGPWRAIELARRLQRDPFLARVMPRGREQVPWSQSAMILVISRLRDPSSERHTSEQWSPKTALPELPGVPIDRADDNRLSRALDELLPHKEALEVPLKNRLGELFQGESGPGSSRGGSG